MNRKNTIFLALTALFSQMLVAQEHINIEVSSNKFTPNFVNINPGDTVTWTNVQGFHNVNGSTNIFPNNPESFSNSVSGPGWTYSFVFTQEGSYEYHCDPHASFMQGAIVVEAPNGLKTRTEERAYSAFPNPVRAGNTLELMGFSTETKLYAMDGSLIITNFNYGIHIPENLKPGSYYITDGKHRQQIIVTP